MRNRIALSIASAFLLAAWIGATPYRDLRQPGGEGATECLTIATPALSATDPNTAFDNFDNQASDEGAAAWAPAEPCGRSSTDQVSPVETTDGAVRLPAASVGRTQARVLRVTAYCDRGLTAAGVPSGVGQCAAPANVPFGSIVHIPAIGRSFVVTDRTHERFRHNTVDIFVPERGQCLRFGRRHLEVIIEMPQARHRYGSRSILETVSAVRSSNDARRLLGRAAPTDWPAGKAALAGGLQRPAQSFVPVLAARGCDPDSDPLAGIHRLAGVPPIGECKPIRRGEWLLASSSESPASAWLAARRPMIAAPAID